MLCSQRVALQTYRALFKVGRVPLHEAHSDVTGNILIIGMTRHHRALQATCVLPVTYTEAAQVAAKHKMLSGIGWSLQSAHHESAST